ncbi:hypothetical protein PSTT_16885, partial [Puccinia striiformis]
SPSNNQQILAEDDRRAQSHFQERQRNLTRRNHWLRMSQSRRQSNRQPENPTYVSTSRSFVTVPRAITGGDDANLDTSSEPEDIFDVSGEEEEIKKLIKLIEPEYLRQKLEPSMADVHLKTAISESKQEIRNLALQLESIDTLIGDLAEFNHTQIGDQLLKDFDQHARELIEAIQLVEFRQTELEEIREKVRASNNNRTIDAHDQLCKKLSTQLVKWNSMTLRQKFAQNKRYKDIRERIWEATGGEGVMPPVKTYLPAAPGEEDEEDSSGDELEIAGGRQNYKCPLCIGFLTIPVVSQLCSHPFCKGCFEAYLEQNGGTSAPCPNAGCSKTIDAQSVQVDQALAVRVRHQTYEDEHHTQRESIDLVGDDDNKDNLNGRRKPAASQKKRRVVVDDDDD